MDRTKPGFATKVTEMFSVKIFKSVPCRTTVRLDLAC